MRGLFNKQYIVLGLVILLALVILISVLFTGKPNQNAPLPIQRFTPQSSPSTDLKDLKVVQIKPDKTTTLKSGQTQTFTLQFNKPIAENIFSIEFSKIDITRDTSSVLEFKKTLGSNNRVLNISLIKPITSYSQYDLTIKTQSNGIIFQTSFLSDTAQLTPVKNNNVALASYLPYETDSFRLTYITSQNVYIFNFKYNFNSSEDLQTQFEKAKAAAIQFIQSKGIDINSVIIEWRYR